MKNLVSSRLGQRLLAFARASLRAMAEDASSYAGRWVALDRCHYAEGSESPSSGRVVDSDPDLGELCSRLRNASRHRCVIVRVDDGYVPVVGAGEPTLRKVRTPLPSAA